MNTDDELVEATDRELVLRASQPETRQSALEAIAQRYHQRILRICAQELREKDSALDAAQDTLADLVGHFSAGKSLTDPGALGGFIYTTASRNAMRYMRGGTAGKGHKQSLDVLGIQDLSEMTGLLAADRTDAFAVAEDVIGEDRVRHLLDSEIVGTLSARHQVIYEHAVRRGLIGPVLAASLGMSADQAKNNASYVREVVRKGFGAFTLFRSERGQCQVLDAIVAAAVTRDGNAFTQRLREEVTRHFDTCATCGNCQTCGPLERRLAAEYAPGLIPVIFAGELWERIQPVLHGATQPASSQPSSSPAARHPRRRIPRTRASQLTAAAVVLVILAAVIAVGLTAFGSSHQRPGPSPAALPPGSPLAFTLAALNTTATNPPLQVRGAQYPQASGGSDSAALLRRINQGLRSPLDARITLVRALTAYGRQHPGPIGDCTGPAVVASTATLGLQGPALVSVLYKFAPENYCDVDAVLPTQVTVTIDLHSGQVLSPTDILTAAGIRTIQGRLSPDSSPDSALCRPGPLAPKDFSPTVSTLNGLTTTQPAEVNPLFTASGLVIVFSQEAQQCGLYTYGTAPYQQIRDLLQPSVQADLAQR